MPCAVCLSCMFSLPLHAVLSRKSSTQGHRTVGQARKGEWTSDVRALNVSLSWYESRQATKQDTGRKYQEKP